MSRHHGLLAMGLLLTLGGLGLESATAPPAPAGGQNPPPPAVENSPVVVKTESNMVLVDVIVTDKKGHYIRDLEKQDFHIYEDNAEQTLSSFSREADLQPNAPAHPRYMVLFFDDSTMDPKLQLGAREEAGKFVESTASPQRLIAVVNFAQSLKVAQNFTADGELLKRAVSTVSLESGQPHAEPVDLLDKPKGRTSRDRTASDVDAGGPLLSIRQVAQSLGAVPERKTLILFSSGFELTPERQSEITPTLDALNKADIAVYPVDVHGLASPASSSTDCRQRPHWGEVPDPNCLNGEPVPNVASSGSANAQVLYALAKGSGGFEISNSNDFLQSLNKVAKEMNEYYNLGYTPPNQTHDGSYHKIKVNVGRAGAIVRSRTGYYDVKSPDPLQGKPAGKALEARVAGPETGEIPVSLRAPYFYVEPGVARVNLALSVSGSALDFEKQNATFHCNVNVLGIAYRENGSIAARFSDTVKLDYQKKDLKDFAKGPFDYQNSFNIAPGSYTLKLVLSAGGEKFCKYVGPLVVEPFSGNDLRLGGPALGDRFLPVPQLIANLRTVIHQERAPLIFQGMELVPSTNYRFTSSAQPVVYLEVYDPALKNPDPPRVGVMFNIIDKQTNQQVFSSDTMFINDYSQSGNPLVPMGFNLPVDGLRAGDYRLEVKGQDEIGNVSTVRSADFSIE